jgi:putative flippase GtrA
VKQLFFRLFNTELPKGLITQSIRFVIVGGFTAGLDVVILIGLVEILKMNYLEAAAIGFLSGSTANYFLSRQWVFYSGRFESTGVEYVTFILLTGLGLGINQTIMYLGVQYFLIQYYFVKTFSLVMVTAFNFATKKFIIFSH